MLNGIRLVEALVQKPLQAVIGLSLAAIIWLGVFAIQSDKVHSEIIKDQEVTTKYQDKQQAKQEAMFELLIRIDENVKALKD